MSQCHSHCNTSTTNPSVHQSLDELDFERGIWYAAQHGDLDRVTKLLSKIPCPDQLDAAGYTALHYAARSGHLSTCKCLVDAGASVNAATRSGQATPLHRAISARKEDVVKFLLDAGSDALLVDADGKNILHRAVETGCSNIVNIVLALDVSVQLKHGVDHKGNIPEDYVGENEHLLGLLQ